MLAHHLPITKFCSAGWLSYPHARVEVDKLYTQARSLQRNISSRYCLSVRKRKYEQSSAGSSLIEVIPGVLFFPSGLVWLLLYCGGPENVVEMDGLGLCT